MLRFPQHRPLLHHVDPRAKLCVIGHTIEQDTLPIASLISKLAIPYRDTTDAVKL
jgi:hypothetical protein